MTNDAICIQGQLTRLAKPTRLRTHLFTSSGSVKSVASTMGVDHGGMRGCIPPTTEAGGVACTIIPPPYKGDEQIKSIQHNTQINTPEEVVSYIDDEIIFSRKFE